MQITTIENNNEFFHHKKYVNWLFMNAIKIMITRMKSFFKSCLSKRSFVTIWKKYEYDHENAKKIIFLSFLHTFIKHTRTYFQYFTNIFFTIHETTINHFMNKNNINTINKWNKNFRFRQIKRKRQINNKIRFRNKITFQHNNNNNVNRNWNWSFHVFNVFSHTKTMFM